MRALATVDDPVREVREIFVQQAAAAGQELGGSAPAAIARIHDARKQIKRARATLRLLRRALGDDVYRRENIALRDVARPLSTVRDSEVLLDTLDGVVEHFGDTAGRLPLEGMRRALKSRRAQLKRTHASRRQIDALVETLRRIERRASRWRFEEHGWPALAASLKSTYRRSRAAMKAAKSMATEDNLHEWRKQSKYFWHQLQILEPLSPGKIGGLADEVHRLSDYFGDEHDLAVLRQEAFQTRHGMSEAAAGALQELIDRRRADLQAKAFALGERLYADKPGAVAKRFSRYWSQWAQRQHAA